MKTTMNLPDPLLAAVKERAASEGRTITSFVEAALRARLEESRHTDREPLRLPTWGGDSANGYLVDITNRDALWAALDEHS